MFVHEDVF